MTSALIVALCLAGVVAGTLSIALGMQQFVRYLERRAFRKTACIPPPDVAFNEEFAEVCKIAGGFSGVEARFGCGHVQRIQLMEKGSCRILRNVYAPDAYRYNCHGCWLRYGIDRRSLPPRTEIA